MGDATLRILHHATFEVAISSPTNWSEVSKALRIVEGQAKAHAIDTTYDDAVYVRSTEDEIIFYFDVAVRAEEVGGA